jgi:hypothetical protein
MKVFIGFGVFLAAAVPGLARLQPQVCGTHADQANEELFLHRQAFRKASPGRFRPLQALAGAAIPRDVGNIALIDDSGGVVSRRNPFDLNQKLLRFVPTDGSASTYRYELAAIPAPPTTGNKRTTVPMGDDDSKQIALPFPFPFFGKAYTDIFVNSDGNATFTGGDAGSTDRSFGRFTGGLPRIAPLFTDLDPSLSSVGVIVNSDSSFFAVDWTSVPLYASSGVGRFQTFGMRLYPDGRIEFTWSDAVLTDAVVGIAPGRSQGPSNVVSFTGDKSGNYTSAVGERFSGTDSIDVVAAAQQFFATHEDAYDYLVIYNAMGLAAAPGAVAYELTVRNPATGFGTVPIDIGQDFGSPRRLQSVLNLGPLAQYPVDPNAIVPARFLSRDTPLSIIGHETGHLFLAYASIPNPGSTTGQPMLGRQLAHWSFLFNSEASLLEGTRIQDNGEGASPRFITTAVSQGYAPLDQYLMGFRAPEEVPATFLVSNSPEVFSGDQSPQIGVAFNGTRRDITVDDLAAAVGKRTPDYTVAQRRFRFGFVLIVAAGSSPSVDQIAQIEKYRSMFEDYYRNAASGRATADTTLKRAVHLSAFPSAGVINSSMMAATVSLDHPPVTPLTVLLQSDSGAISLPPAAVIPAGAISTTFYMFGMRTGVDTLTAIPTDSTYETAFAKIQVADSTLSLHLDIVSRGDAVVLRVADLNELPYPNIIVRATASDGTVNPSSAISDSNGLVRFQVNASGLSAQINGGSVLTIK